MYLFGKFHIQPPTHTHTQLNSPKHILLPFWRSFRSCSAARDKRDQISSSVRASPLTCRALARVTEAGFIPVKTYVWQSSCNFQKLIWYCTHHSSPSIVQPSPQHGAPCFHHLCPQSWIQNQAYRKSQRNVHQGPSQPGQLVLSELVNK